jgi:hypothetical protein
MELLELQKLSQAIKNIFLEIENLLSHDIETLYQDSPRIIFITQWLQEAGYISPEKIRGILIKLLIKWNESIRQGKPDGITKFMNGCSEL